MLTSACLFSEVTTTYNKKQDRVKHPRKEVYRTPVKCALRPHEPRAHYGEYILRPVALTTAFVFACYF